MVDSEGVAELHGIQQLEKDAPDQGVIADKVPLVGDARKQISFGAEFHDDVGAIHGIHDADQGHDIGVLAGQMVQTDLPLLVLQLAGVQSRPVEGLDGITDVGVDVQGGIYNTVGTDAQDAGEFQTVGQNKS